MLLSHFIISMMAGVAMINTIFAPNIQFSENEKNKELKRFWILLFMNVLLIFAFALMILHAQEFNTYIN